ncbi:MAG: GNAT family N-acetyltransferase [Anaerolineae bacterium]|nr:GNAT family N-acetyltransferase [Anaerolineae bacterium]
MTLRWNTIELTDKPQILAYLETDRLYAAYAVGDLEPELFAHCEWFGAQQDGQLQALALHYGGLGFPIMFLMGDVGGLRAIFEDALYIEQAYFTCRQEHLEIMQDFYEWESIPMWRMVLRPDRFRPVGGDCVPLTSGHAEQLAALYAHGEGNAFDPAQVPGGAFHGGFEDGRLVAAAGTHLINSTYGVAAVGNIFTHPGFRGRGYASAATSAVVAELLSRGMRDIVLNVNQKNETAIRIYERLGFERYCPFLEGMAFVRATHS